MWLYYSRLSDTRYIIQNRFAYQGAGLPSKKNPPLGPLSGNVAAHTIPCTPSSTGRPPWPPISVDTHPGSTELTKIPVPLSSAAKMRENAFRAALETLYAGIPPAM